MQHQVWHADDIGNEDVVNCWDKAAQEFTSFFAKGEEFYHKHIINPALIDLLGEIEGKTILDLACGEGRLARNLAQIAGRDIRITGVDASEHMIRVARERSQNFTDCLTFQQADAADLAQIPPDSFDVAICNMALMDIKNYTQAIREVRRTLKTHGAFIFSVLHPCFFTPRSEWLRNEDGEIVGWKVDDYHLGLVSKWAVKSGMTMETYHFHRTLEDYCSALAECGFVITEIREPIPPKELLEANPRLIRELKRGGFLLVKSILPSKEPWSGAG